MTITRIPLWRWAPFIGRCADPSRAVPARGAYRLLADLLGASMTPPQHAAALLLSRSGHLPHQRSSRWWGSSHIRGPREELPAAPCSRCAAPLNWTASCAQPGTKAETPTAALYSAPSGSRNRWPGADRVGAFCNAAIGLVVSVDPHPDGSWLFPNSKRGHHGDVLLRQLCPFRAIRKAFAVMGIVREERIGNQRLILRLLDHDAAGAVRCLRDGPAVWDWRGRSRCEKQRQGGAGKTTAKASGIVTVRRRVFAAWGKDQIIWGGKLLRRTSQPDALAVRDKNSATGRRLWNWRTS